MGQVIPVLTNKLIPLEEPLGTLAWVGLTERLERFVCGFASGVCILGAVVWSRGPDLVAAWVVHVESFSRFCLDPFASDEALVMPEIWVVDLFCGKYTTFQR